MASMKTGLHPLHWPHLILLVSLPAWLWATTGGAAELRLGGVLAFAFVLLGVAERLRPHRRDWRPSSRELRRDGSVLALNLFADAGIGAVLALLATYAAADAHALPLVLQVPLGIAIGELGSYALHRCSHRDGWLWRAHLLHHRPARLNVANALTAHPLNAIYDKAARLLPLLLLGFEAEAVLAVSAFSLLQGLVVHANVAGTIGWLEYVIGSAALHRLHHSRDPADAGNFGTAVPWWDLVFGTFRRGNEPAGVGVYDASRYPPELALASLLAWPLRRHEIGSAASGQRVAVRLEELPE
jgi:sterol desaturase/sphingolipid hydroxylase (fatty acid hydroxylase superfamily)